MDGLTESDLWEVCSTCGGTGEPFHQMRELKPGEMHRAADWIPKSTCCVACHGKKGQPTATGKAILALLKNVNAAPVHISTMVGRPPRKPQAQPV